MTKKIAFISRVTIKIPKEVGEQLDIEGEIEVTYRHPVLYLIRQYKKSKDYLYLYCGKPTYVVMKIKDTNLAMFESMIEKVLREIGIKEYDIICLQKEIYLYSRISNIISQIYKNILREAMEQYRGYIPIIKHFHPIFRRKIERCLAKIITDDVAQRVIKDYYFRQPQEVRSMIGLTDWINIIKAELNKKGIIKTILNTFSEFR